MRVNLMLTHTEQNTLYTYAAVGMVALVAVFVYLVKRGQHSPAMIEALIADIDASQPARVTFTETYPVPEHDYSCTGNCGRSCGLVMFRDDARRDGWSIVRSALVKPGLYYVTIGMTMSTLDAFEYTHEMGDFAPNRVA